jgi:hypothetical protein
MDRRPSPVVPIGARPGPRSGPGDAAHGRRTLGKENPLSESRGGAQHPPWAYLLHRIARWIGRASVWLFSASPHGPGRPFGPSLTRSPSSPFSRCPLASFSAVSGGTPLDLRPLLSPSSFSSTRPGTTTQSRGSGSGSSRRASLCPRSPSRARKSQTHRAASGTAARERPPVCSR